jgi:hypothetical protein
LTSSFSFLDIPARFASFPIKKADYTSLRFREMRHFTRFLKPSWFQEVEGRKQMKKEVYEVFSIRFFNYCKRVLSARKKSLTKDLSWVCETMATYHIVRKSKAVMEKNEKVLSQLVTDQLASQTSQIDALIEENKNINAENKSLREMVDKLSSEVSKLAVIVKDLRKKDDESLCHQASARPQPHGLSSWTGLNEVDPCTSKLDCECAYCVRKRSDDAHAKTVFCYDCQRLKKYCREGCKNKIVEASKPGTCNLCHLPLKWCPCEKPSPAASASTFPSRHFKL